MFCTHEWKLLSETVTKSRFEVATESIKGMNSGNLPWQLCDAERKHIQTFTCNKCGALKRFVESI